MNDYYLNLTEALNSVEVTPTTATLKIFISFLLGAIIGLERQSRRQSAGMRTISLICIASTAAMLVSIWIPQTYPNALNGDPSRIAAQVLSGVGFLGAGAIIQSHGSVKGLTTAATIWIVSIIGLCVGAGLYIAGVVLTVFSIFVLFIMDKYEQRKLLSGDIKLLKIKFPLIDPKIDDLINKLKSHKIFIYDVSIEKDYETSTSTLGLRIHISPKETLEVLFKEIQSIEKISSISLNSL